MNRLAFLVFCCLQGGLSAGEGGLPRFVLAAPERMADAPVERVREWMQRNLHYEVKVLRIPAWAGETATEQLAELPELPVQSVLVTVVMTERLEEGRHAMIIPERRLGFMQVPVLFEGETERDFRRLERQAMRIVGFSLGVPAQPMPFCALAPYRTLEELDRMGRGFSPPAMAQYRSRLVELGIPLSPEAERYLPDVRVNLPSLPETRPNPEETD